MEVFQRISVQRAERRRRGAAPRLAKLAGARRPRFAKLRGFERMEPRCLLAADILHVGAVYTESDLGSDAHGDTFEITFSGGATGTQLTRLTIDGDQNGDGFGEGDSFFDTNRSGLGADDAFGFTLVSLDTLDPTATVDAVVVDGSTQLELQFSHFVAGDRLIFSLDVDEVEEFDAAETDLTLINDGFDPITSGIEFQGARFSAWFSAPHSHAVSGDTECRTRYDDLLAETSLDLPADDVHGLRDRTAGAVAELRQEPKPVSISGTVFLDDDLDLHQSSTADGISGVHLALWKLDGESYVDTRLSTVTGPEGQYEFGRELGLSPGTYQVRETQPLGLFSVGAIPGSVQGPGSVGGPGAGDGASVGAALADNPDVLTHIAIPLGDLDAVDYDFAEARPAGLSGYVFHDRNDDGVRDAGEEGLAGVEIRIVPVDTIAPLSSNLLLTNQDGFYEAVDLPPGAYRLVEMRQPVGYFDGLDAAGTVDGVPTGIADNPGDRIDSISLDGGVLGRNYDFGELLPVSLSGRVHLTDELGNCLGGESQTRPIAGVTILLLDSSGTEVAVTTTNAQGQYAFDGLRPGEYTLVETTQAGLIDGAEHLGTVDGQLRGRLAGNDRITAITLVSGESGEHYDFCESEPASLAGVVYHDRNDNGRREDGEQPIADVQIVLRDSSGNEVARRLTDSDGAYQFDQLRADRYSIEQMQPAGWLDGKDSVGAIDGRVVGTARLDADAIDQVVLGWGQAGVDYNFGELLPASIAGIVHTDPDRDCVFDDGETLLADVTIQLLDGSGAVIATTTTDSAGRYQFDGLRPGEYAIREIQPDGLFDGGQRAGLDGELLLGGDRLSAVQLGSGDELTDYDFCEIPPAILSGYVFQDGAELVTEDGLPPENLFEIRDGRRTADDTPIAGVVIELRDGSTGEPIDGSTALPAYYADGSIRTQTDGLGFYEFRGLPPGSYAVYETHPDAWFDGIDTPGSTSGVAVNANAEVDPLVPRQLVLNPRNDAILLIPLPSGAESTDNNFSEILVSPSPPTEPPPSFEDTPPPPPQVVAPPIIVQVPPVVTPLVPVSLLEIPQYGSGAFPAMTWHLSVLDGGTPRGRHLDNTARLSTTATVHLTSTNWSTLQLNQGVWTLPVAQEDEAPRLAERGSVLATTWTTPDTVGVRKFLFGVPGAIPVSGDFDGDGDSDLGVFYNGEWYIDLNGNGRWDSEDLWAKLGGDADLPITGDWDGDGKDDIGIFGPTWPGDRRALRGEPGVPDSNNRPTERPKNVPPSEHEATGGRRLLKRTAAGEPRGDVIDHVFRFGLNDDHPLAGDWNGDGIDTIGVFRNGKWHLDSNGDGRWSEGDEVAWFGASGDVPVVGDFNGDGIDELGVYRDGKWLLDTNGDRKLTSHDRVFELGGPGDTPVVGDWNGDGIDDPGLYRSAEP